MDKKIYFKTELGKMFSDSEFSKIDNGSFHIDGISDDVYKIITDRCPKIIDKWNQYHGTDYKNAQEAVASPKTDDSEMWLYAFAVFDTYNRLENFGVDISGNVPSDLENTYSLMSVLSEHEVQDIELAHNLYQFDQLKENSIISCEGGASTYQNLITNIEKDDNGHVVKIYGQMIPESIDCMDGAFYDGNFNDVITAEDISKVFLEIVNVLEENVSQERISEINKSCKQFLIIKENIGNAVKIAEHLINQKQDFDVAETGLYYKTYSDGKINIYHEWMNYSVEESQIILNDCIKICDRLGLDKNRIFQELNISHKRKEQSHELN